MDIIQFIRILLKHLWLLIIVPLILAISVLYLTRNPTFEYQSSTKLYTGIASGASLEGASNMSYLATSNAFDNLINVIKSRETLGETAIRLFAQGLILDQYDPAYISKESFIELRRIVPQYIKDMVVKPLLPNDSLSFAIAWNKTTENFINFKNSSDTNFIYNLLNYQHKYYSIKAVSRVSVKRIQNSDLIELSYKSEDPGITVQTLKILTRVLEKNYRQLRENQSDVVVSYFQGRVDLAREKLKDAEERLQTFNTENQIINYNEQTKFIAAKKESIEEYIQNEKMKLMGAEEALKRLENKLQVQGQIQTTSDKILDMRNRLVEVTEKITINELYDESDTLSKSRLSELKTQARELETGLRNEISKLYSYRNTIEGLPISNILNQWLDNLIKYSEAKAGLRVLEARQQEFMKNYEVFAPLGATMKKLEREIDVAEREYLSLIHSLNTAQLEQQNQEIGSSIKPVDEPYFPLNPEPTKRKIFVLAAGLIGFIMVAFAILATEYFDNTIKTIERAEELTGLESMGVFPKIISKYRSYDLSFINHRLSELCVQEIKSRLGKDVVSDELQSTKFIILFSTQEIEGKTFIANKITTTLRSQGENVLYLNYTLKSIHDMLDESSENDDFKENDVDFSIESEEGKSSDEKYTGSYSELDSEMLANKHNILYHIDETFSEKQDVFDLIQNHEINTLDNFRYVFIEIPSILYYPYPNDIIKNADLSILTVRSNREWKKADQAALNLYSKITQNKPGVILNATDINEIENKLGTLPKRRSFVRRAVKQLLKLQFYSRQSIK